jgi:hypothetical protein
MELILITPKTPEWEYMWEWLSDHPINEGLELPWVALHEGEAWQYMGSYHHKGEVIHSFRHRHHPKTLAIQNVSVKGSDLFTPDQIVKK